MAKAYEITEEISNEIRMIRKTIKNKSEDIRLYAVELRGLGNRKAVWHKSKDLEISGNIIMTHIPPYTPEMNPIEQI